MPGFALVEQHIEVPRRLGGAKVVLSRMAAGRSLLGAPAPSLKLVLEGEETYEIDGRPVRVGAGQFLYLDRGADCTGTNRTETVGLCLLLPGGAAAAEGDPVIGRSLLLSTRASTLGRALESYGRRIARDPALGPLLAGEIVARAGRAIAEPMAESRAAIEALNAAKPSTRRDLYQRLERARAFLHGNEDRAVPLSELAGVAGLSQFHLARYFKLAFGKAPGAYHRGLRLARAASLLAGDGCSVAEAAEAAGYSDQVSLTHAFRRQYGLPPQQWAAGRRA